jgi:aryl-alcohol dehydrogenase-like predicted oxidoreductase
VALRWYAVVVAPLVGASKPSHLHDAVSSLEIELTDHEAAELEATNTPPLISRASPTTPS